ncbi:MBL fold metallo-hydrolase [Novosphingobium flavum]|uniref:MBL fold metallo-hydrolase n=1 Tax=Novosphingobium flavum TaxID=1778672 RepID=A0A7X1KLK0_9SPHN|nr:MBL fold metallo-hydrolase [Novosphingobium flavum]MBC2665669.1 MBL fold metallo-hydrolase [Novosphingobium flavum]
MINKAVHTGLAMAAALGAMAPGAALAQQAAPHATPASAGIAQPHLVKALEIAAGESNWKHTALLTCYPEQAYTAQEVIRDPGAARVFDNFYYLGNGVVGSWAVDTPEGIILIDTMNDQAEADRYILAGMKKLGLDPKRIRIILVSHGHGDHYGGAKYLQDTYGAKVYMPKVDYDMAALRTGDKARPQPRLDVDIKDGDTVSLGGTALKVFITPGHTKGSVSLLIPVQDKGRATTIAYFGGITNRRISPEMHAGYEAWTERFLSLIANEHVEGYIGNHPSYDDTAGRIAYRRLFPKEANPFVSGTPETLRFVRVLQECNRNNTEIEKQVAGLAEPTRGTHD